MGDVLGILLCVEKLVERAAQRRLVVSKENKDDGELTDVVRDIAWRQYLEYTTTL